MRSHKSCRVFISGLTQSTRLSTHTLENIDRILFDLILYLLTKPQSNKLETKSFLAKQACKQFIKSAFKKLFQSFMKSDL